MALNNSQYDEIFRSYDAKQLKAQHQLEERTKAAYERSPELKALGLYCGDFRGIRKTSLRWGQFCSHRIKSGTEKSPHKKESSHERTLSPGKLFRAGL